MPKWVKIVVAIVAVVVCACVATCGAGYVWISRNAASMHADGLRRIEEGKTFGVGRSAPECVTEGLRRLDACAGLLCEVNARVFAAGCMQSSQTPADFCEGVPRLDEILRTASWRVRYCVDTLGRENDQRCVRFSEAIQRRCHAPTGM